MDKFNDTLLKINNFQLKSFILGDLNINTYCKSFGNLPTMSKDFINTITSNGFSPLIDIPTRITSSTATLLDHIICNKNNFKFLPGVINFDLSDHFLTFVIASGLAEITNRDPVFYRSMKNFNAQEFDDEVSYELAPFLNSIERLTYENINSSFNDFISKFKHVIDKHAPLRKLSRRQKTLAAKPWITKGILVSIKKRKRCTTHILKMATYSNNSYLKNTPINLQS